MAPVRSGPVPTLVRLSSSLTRVSEGQELVLAAQVSALEQDDARPATGTVAFLDGDRLLGAAPLDASGQAVLAGVQLAPGVHAVTAAYAGDSAHAAGSSAPLPQTVTTARTPVTVLVSQPVTTRGGVRLDAELLDLTTGRLAVGAAGALVFSVEDVALVRVPLVDGRAQVVVPELPDGRLRVAYAGDAEHAAATGSRSAAVEPR